MAIRQKLGDPPPAPLGTSDGRTVELTSPMPSVLPGHEWRGIVTETNAMYDGIASVRFELRVVFTMVPKGAR